MGCTNEKQRLLGANSQDPNGHFSGVLCFLQNRALRPTEISWVTLRRMGLTVCISHGYTKTDQSRGCQEPQEVTREYRHCPLHLRLRARIPGPASSPGVPGKPPWDWVNWRGVVSEAPCLRSLPPPFRSPAPPACASVLPR